MFRSLFPPLLTLDPFPARDDPHIPERSHHRNKRQTQADEPIQYKRQLPQMSFQGRESPNHHQNASADAEKTEFPAANI